MNTIPRSVRLLSIDEIRDRFDIDYILKLMEHVDKTKPIKLIRTFENTEGLISEFSKLNGGGNPIKEQPMSNKVIKDDNDTVEIPRELYIQLLKYVKPNE